MDIKAAYDSVDHILLFNKLKETGLDPQMLRITKALFTNIQSVISVNGVDSKEFTHTAGVLQGAILSPMLYSLYIDDLARVVKEVRNADVRSVFMYADDLAFLAEDDDQLQSMITKAEEHSERMNYRFNANKCEVMNSPSTFTIYGNNLVNCEEFKYLGCIFDKNGINWRKHFSRLVLKTERFIQFFRSIGFNGKGFRERTKLHIFKSNIRSLFEYGLAIMPPCVTYLKSLEKVQHKALCTMLGVGIRTSRASIQTLTGVISVRARYDELSFRNVVRIRNQNESFLAYKVRNMSKKFLKRKSCFALIETHPILLEHERISSCYDLIKREAQTQEGFERVNDKSADKWTIEDTILFVRHEYFIDIRKDTLFLKESRIDADCKPRHFYQLGKMPHEWARLCILFILGKLPGKPRKCKVCGGIGKNTVHFITCLNKEFMLRFLNDWEWEKIKFHIYDIVEIMEDFVNINPESCISRRERIKLL